MCFFNPAKDAIRANDLLSAASEHLVIEEWDSGYRITARMKEGPPPVMGTMTGSVEELEG